MQRGATRGCRESIGTLLTPGTHGADPPPASKVNVGRPRLERTSLALIASLSRQYARTCELLGRHHLDTVLEQAAPPAAAGRTLLARARSRRRGRLSVCQARQQIPGGYVLLVTGHESCEGSASGRIRVAAKDPSRLILLYHLSAARAAWRTLQLPDRWLRAASACEPSLTPLLLEL
jgi:hypothetical protein